MPNDASTLDAFDVGRARADTPGCTKILHFNNAGSALPPQPVLNAQIEHLNQEAHLGGYEAAAYAEDQLQHTYDAIATLIGAEAEEIALVENATRAWDMAFYGMDFSEGDRILTSEASYASNYIAMLQVAERTGAEVEVIPSDTHGQIDLHALCDAINDRTALIALTHVPTNGGLVNPAAEVGAVAQDAGVPYLLDACQSAGQLPLDVDELGCTMLSATGRKYLRGPRGTGFLYVQRDWIERITPPLLDLHAATLTSATSYRIRPDAKRFETWEGNVAGKIGLGVAVDYALDWGLDAIAARVQHLADTLRQALRQQHSITVHDTGAQQCGLVTFSIEGNTASKVQHRLRTDGLNVSVSTPSSTLLDAEARDLPELVRASLHYYNTTQEIERFVATLNQRFPIRNA